MSARRYHPSELPPYLQAALRRSTVDPKHGWLDRLMDDPLDDLRLFAKATDAIGPHFIRGTARAWLAFSLIRLAARLSPKTVAYAVEELAKRRGWRPQ